MSRNGRGFIGPCSGRGAHVDLYRSTNPDWSLYEPIYDILDFEWLLPLNADNLRPEDMREQLPAPTKSGILMQFNSK
jgi:hypothetical protein